MTTVGDELAQAIDSWLVKRKTRNLNLLSRSSGVSYATVRRIATRECAATAEVAASIASVVMTKNDAKKLFEQYFPALAHIFSFDSAIEKSENDELQAFFNSRNHYPVIVLAHAVDGIDEELVIKRLGYKYLGYFHDLIDADVLHVRGNRFYVDKGIGCKSREIARKHLASLLDITAASNDDVPAASSAYTYCASINRVTANKILDLQTNFKTQVHDLITSKSSKGNILWYAGWLQNVLLNEDQLK